MNYPIQIKEKLLTQGTYLVSGSVTLEMTRDIFQWIISNPKKKDFTIALHSTGGNPTAAQDFTALKRTLDPEIKIRGVAFSECGSAALALFQCCDTRTAVAGCAFFIHNMQHKPSIDCEDFDLKKLKANIRNTKKLHEELVAYQANRCNMTKKKWRKLATKGSLSNRPIFCDEAKALGLIDEIVPAYKIF